MTVVYNPFDPGFQADPYPSYASLREQHPCHPVGPPGGPQLLTRYADVNAVLHDRQRFSVDHRNLSNGPELDLPYHDLATILFRDPPQHTRWRQQLSKGLAQGHIEAYRPRLTELIDERLDVLEENGEADFFNDVAAPIPFQAICELIGIPESDRPQVSAWVSDIVNLTEPIALPEVTAAIVRSNEQMRAYLRDLCAHKRTHPADDVISRLLAVTTGGFSEDELIDHVMLLAVSAPEPTASHLTYGVLALTRYPEQADQLRDDPGQDRAVVEEVLRWEAPLQVSGRYPLVDVEFHGRTVPAGTALVLSFASANHDTEKWGPTADDFDVDRGDAAQHLSFARGVHTCFGAVLARMHGELTFGRLVRRFPGLRLAGEPEWNALLNRRGMTRLLVAVR